MLLVLSSFVAVMLMRYIYRINNDATAVLRNTVTIILLCRWKNQKPIINNYINYDKDLLVRKKLILLMSVHLVSGKTVPYNITELSY